MEKEDREIQEALEWFNSLLLEKFHEQLEKKGYFMKEEDKKIKYRPELADKLESCMKDAIKLYREEPKKVYYLLMSLLCEEKEDLEGKELFWKSSECFDKENRFGAEEYYEHYYKDIKERYGSDVADITSASAARLVFAIYKEDIEQSFDAIDTSGFSKQEKYMVEHFKNIVLSPTENPNIQIKDGNAKCYYDYTRGGNYEFERAVKSGIEFIERECQVTLEIFRTPDKEQTVEEEMEK